MKADELRGKTTEELESELLTLKETLFNQRFRNVLGQQEDTTHVSVKSGRISHV